jgi:hypothetical protein
MPTPCYLLRLFRFQYIVHLHFEATGLLHVRWPKNKKRRGGNFFSLGGKKLKLFCLFWRWLAVAIGLKKMQMCFVCGLDFFSFCF